MMIPIISFLYRRGQDTRAGLGAEGLQLIWLNTWNNWAESTTVEPTANLRPKYPAGNYQFDMVEVVREVFGVETYYSSP